jgi:predicted transcriptional regulator
MQDSSKHAGLFRQQVESVVVATLLAGERPRSIRELQARTGYERGDVIEAAASLEDAGVVIVRDGELHASSPAKRIDALGMIVGWAL